MEELRKIIELDKIYELQNRGLKVELIGSWVWVSGNTRPHKELLKSYKFKFSKNKRAWSYHQGGRYRKKTDRNYNLEELREMF